jgi:hypothetical protein
LLRVFRTLSIAVLFSTLFCPPPTRSQVSAPSAPVMTQPPQPDPQAGKQRTKEEERGTQDAPLFMKGEITTQKSERDARDDGEERKERGVLERELVHYTGLSFYVAVVMVLVATGQIWLFLWQLKLMRGSLKQAEATANAALRSANAMHASERAYVFAHVIRARIEPTVGSTPESAVTVEFVNYGKTPAIIIRCLGASLFSSSPPQSHTSIDQIQSQWPDGFVIASGKSMKLDVPIHITSQHFEEISRRATVLYCLGTIEYKDFLGERHETGFCWQHNPMSDRETKFDFFRDSHVNHCT